jgi:SdpI/YhfL family protein
VDLIPVPELVAAAIVSLLFLAARSILRFWSIRSVPPAADPRASRNSFSDTERVRVRLIASCVLFAIISIPLILRVVPPNGSYGFRTHATQSSQAVWYAANAFMGWSILTASGFCATLLFTLPAGVSRWVLWATFLLSMFAALAASSAYVARLS